MKFTGRTHLPAWGWTLVALFGAALVAAFVLDLRGRGDAVAVTAVLSPGEEVVAALRTLGAARARSEEGRFEMAVPPDWTRAAGAEVAPYQLAVRNLHGASISIMATPVGYDDLRLLSEEIRRRERQRDLAILQETLRLEDRMVILRRIQLVSQNAMAIDFVEGRVAYHLMCAAPAELFATYEPLFLAAAKTLRALPAVIPEAAPPQDAAAGTPDRS